MGETNTLPSWPPGSHHPLLDLLEAFATTRDKYQERKTLQILVQLCRERPGASIETSELESKLRAGLTTDTCQTSSEEKITSQTVHSAAYGLRKALSKFSKTIDPLLGISISKSRRNYQIITSGAPRPWWVERQERQSIGILLANAHDWFSGRLLAGVLEVVREYRFDLVIEDSGDDRKKEAGYLIELARRNKGLLFVPVDDRLIYPESIKLLEDRKSVLVDRYIPGLSSIPCAHHDDYLGGRAVAQYLGTKKCKRVIIIQQRTSKRSNQSITPLTDRVEGCLAGCIEQGIDCEQPAARGSEEHGGFQALEEFHREFPLGPEDGIFATTDKLAIGCRHFIASLWSKYEQAPRDDPAQKLEVAPPPSLDHVVGFEGQTFGDFLDPQLPSVSADPTELGRLAACILLQRMKIDLRPIDCKGIKTEVDPHYLARPTLLLPAANKRTVLNILDLFGDESVDAVLLEAREYYRKRTAGPS